MNRTCWRLRLQTFSAWPSGGAARSAAFWIGILLLPGLAHATERWQLVHGGKIVGKAVESSSASAETSTESASAAGSLQRTISPRPGIKVTLASKAIAKRQAVPTEQSEYETIAPTFANTVEAQWKLVKWCDSHGLKAERDHHLRRIVALDPEQTDARQMLGHVWADGKWMTPAEKQARAGYFLYKGRYRSEAEIAKLKEEEQLAKQPKTRQEDRHATEQWMRKLLVWRSQLVGSQAEAVREQLLALNDPLAVPALFSLAWKDSLPAMRRQWIQTLEGMSKREGAAGERSLTALLELSLKRMDNGTFSEVMEILREQQNAKIVGWYVNRLLQIDAAMVYEKHALEVDQIRVVLRQLKTELTVPALIDGLVETRTALAFAKSGPILAPDKTSAASASGVRRDEPMFDAVEVVYFRHSAVLEVLSGITEQSFGFDQRRWTDWYQQQLSSTDGDSPRTLRP